MNLYPLWWSSYFEKIKSDIKLALIFIFIFLFFYSTRATFRAVAPEFILCLNQAILAFPLKATTILRWLYFDWLSSANISQRCMPEVTIVRISLKYKEPKQFEAQVLAPRIFSYKKNKLGTNIPNVQLLTIKLHSKPMYDQTVFFSY